ncbi:protein SUPPRESSOR OF GENE SILENCING 3 homolog [Mercurialis annua]|uniref:protein SUPPRESSOR OF GENE SILENCING 3 homolog n=1 Tax=Mercurialis annua TaxID=3986 RepID=UPI0021601566|nr:protein SUPPRESSOR OF GENE SILENCING 3 homolog [Mercurialis annua]
MAITAAAAFNLVLINDQTQSPTFLNKNNIGDHQLLVDSAIFAQPPTSLFTSQTQPRRCQISCKKTKWFKKFVDALECLSIEEINDPARQWHCSACGRGGTIQRYLGVQTLMQHAKGAGSTRVRLHRELAQLLEQRLHNHNDDQHPTSAKWIALKQEKKDHNIVWPPMVLI